MTVGAALFVYAVLLGTLGPLAYRRDGWLARAPRLGATLLLGILLESVALKHLYGRDHLDQVLATFGLILFFNDLVRLIWGPAGLALPLPAWLTVPVQIIPGVYYPAYRLSIIVVALAVAALLYLVVMRTRIGMLIRAGASNREMIGALGIKVVDERGRRIGFGRASGRYLGKIVSGALFGIGYLIAAWTERKRALHDMIADTCVVFDAVEYGRAMPSDRPPMPWYGWLVNIVGLGAVPLLVGLGLAAGLGW